MIRDINLHAFSMIHEIRNRDRRQIMGKLDRAINPGTRYDTWRLRVAGSPRVATI